MFFLLKLVVDDYIVLHVIALFAECWSHGSGTSSRITGVSDHRVCEVQKCQTFEVRLAFSQLQRWPPQSVLTEETVRRKIYLEQ